jgi:hypothetical protein
LPDLRLAILKTLQGLFVYIAWRSSTAKIYFASLVIGSQMALKNDSLLKT